MRNSSSDLLWTCTIWSMVSKSKRDTLRSIRATRHLPENIRIKRKDSNIESYRRNRWTSSKAALLAPYRLYLERQNNSEHHLSCQRTMYGNIHNRSSLLVVSEHMSHGSKYPTWELFLHGSVYVKLVLPAQCHDQHVVRCGVHLGRWDSYHKYFIDFQYIKGSKRIPCSEEFHQDNADSSIFGIHWINGDSPQGDWRGLGLRFVRVTFSKDFR